jgi:haloacetate dehalogenase
MHAFSTTKIDTGETEIFLRMHGSGPPLLLLHGFPQTHLMWRQVAPRLASRFCIVCADLRGYGESGCPASAADHAPYAKTAMARDMVVVMEKLGFRRFSVCGHDRGGRVAYRMALDYPERIARLAVLDILPIEASWRRADARFALAYWPWSLLAQPYPLPEHILSVAAGAIVDNALSEWGSSAGAFPAQVRAAYRAALQQPEHAHAICEEYRAAASIDREHDNRDRASGQRIRCPVLVLWSARGPLDAWYAEEGGPLALWRDWGDEVEGRALEGGHFFPESSPKETAEELGAFFGRGAAQPAAVMGLQQ